LQPFVKKADYCALAKSAADLTQEFRCVCRKTAAKEKTFFRLAQGRALLSALKPAADNSGAAILRVYNMSAENIGDRAVFAAKIAAVREIDMMEEKPGRQVQAKGGEFAFELAPWQIATYRIEWK
jgi:alpha-mannosidase